MALTHSSREVVTLLLPQIKSHPLATPTSDSLDSSWSEILEASFLIIINGCSDAVLKVFLSSLVSQGDMTEYYCITRYLCEHDIYAIMRIKLKSYI